MSDKDKLKNCFESIIWMAVRYADGRATYAPGMVRKAVEDFKEVFPDFKLKPDSTIEKPSDLGPLGLESDYLHDLFE